MLWNSSKMSGNLRNSAKFFENLRNSSKFFEILQNSSKICEILRNSSKFPRKKNIFEEIIKDSKGFSIFWEDSIAAGIDFYRILLKSFDFIGFSQCPMGRGSGGPPTFSQKNPSWISLGNQSFCQRDEEKGERWEILEVPRSEPKTSSCLWPSFAIQGRKQKSRMGVDGRT